MTQYQAFKILRESGIVLEKRKPRSAMTPEELEEVRAKARARRMRRKNTTTPFERCLQKGMDEVDGHYLSSKDHKPFFVPLSGDGHKYEIDYINDGRSAGSLYIYVKVGPGWFTEGGMRALAKVMNKILSDDGIPLEANENWKYSSGTSPSGIKYCVCMYFKKKVALQVDARNFVEDWTNNQSTVDVEYNGKIYTVKRVGVTDKGIRDNGVKQMCGYYNDVIFATDDRKFGVIVHTGCIHPALGEDISAKVVTGTELQKYLSQVK